MPDRHIKASKHLSHEPDHVRAIAKALHRPKRDKFIHELEEAIGKFKGDYSIKLRRVSGNSILVKYEEVTIDN